MTGARAGTQLRRRFTNISARHVLKMSVSRVLRLSSYVFLVDLQLRREPSADCLTLPLPSSVSVCAGSAARLRHSASAFWRQRCDDMKMISSTRRTSIKGVTLISADCPRCRCSSCHSIICSLYFVSDCGCAACYGCAPYLLCSVSRPNWSTPAERTSSTTSTTFCNGACIGLTKTLY